MVRAGDPEIYSQPGKVKVYFGSECIFAQVWMYYDIPDTEEILLESYVCESVNFLITLLFRRNKLIEIRPERKYQHSNIRVTQMKAVSDTEQRCFVNYTKLYKIYYFLSLNS